MSIMTNLIFLQTMHHIDMKFVKSAADVYDKVLIPKEPNLI